jgi:hypothetical protein
VFAETDRFELDEASERSAASRKEIAGLRLAKKQLIRAIRERVPGDGSKRYVRFSTSFDKEGQKSKERLTDFSKTWVAVESN